MERVDGYRVEVRGEEIRGRWKEMEGHHID